MKLSGPPQLCIRHVIRCMTYLASPAFVRIVSRIQKYRHMAGRLDEFYLRILIDWRELRCCNKHSLIVTYNSHLSVLFTPASPAGHSRRFSDDVGGRFLQGLW